MDVNVAKALVVSKVLIADGMMTDDEHAFLDQLFASLGLSDAQRRAVTELEGVDEAEAIVRGLSVDERRDVVALLVDASSADGKMSPHELEVVKRVTAALGL